MTKRNIFLCGVLFWNICIMWELYIITYNIVLFYISLVEFELLPFLALFIPFFKLLDLFNQFIDFLIFCKISVNWLWIILSIIALSAVWRSRIALCVILIWWENWITLILPYCGIHGVIWDYRGDCWGIII